MCRLNFKKQLLLAFYALLTMPFVVNGQISMTTTGSHTQNFNALTSAATWTDNSTIASWFSQRTGSGTAYALDNGTSNSGNLYSYGTTSASDRGLGSLGSSNASAGDFAHGVLLRNTSGTTITSITVTYTLEQWRNSAAVAQAITFYYKTSSSTISNLNPNSNSTWTAVTALDASSPITGGTPGLLDGNSSSNRVTKSATAIPSLSLANNSYIMLKWEDPDQTGIDHGLAIDDVTISWTVTPACTVPGTPSCTTPSAVCYPSTATITGAGSSPSATTYTYWTASSGGSQITGSTTPAGTVSGNNLTSIASTAAGTYTYYVQGENSTCLSAARQAVVITINNVPAAPSAVSGNALPCPNATGLTYAVTNVAGVTYTWTVPAGWSITAGQGTNSVTVSSGTGSGNITCTPSNSCGNGTAATPLAVSISSSPSAPFFTSSTSTDNVVAPCTGNTSRTYTVTNNASLTYSWSVPSTWTITAGSTSNSITVTVGSTSGNIRCTATNGCSGTAYTDFAVTPISGAPSNPVFTASTSTNNVSLMCNSATGLTYTVNSVSNATYTWSVPAGWTITAGQGTSSITVSASSTSGAVRCTVSNDCGTAYTDFAVTPSIGTPSLPSFTSSTSTNNVISPCASATALTYDITAISGVTYSWSVPSGWNISSGQTTNTLTTDASSTSGNITIQVSNACGNNSNSIAVAPINGVPAQPGTITGTNPVCQNTSGNNYSIGAVATASSYTWSYSGTGATNSSATATATYSFSNAASSGNLSVVASNVCGSSSSRTLSLTINTSPIISLQPVSVSITPGVSTSFSVTASNASTYQWQYSTTGTSGWTNVTNSTPAGVTYTNATTATLNVATTGSTPALFYYYQVIVSSASGCSETSTPASMGLASYVLFDNFTRSNSLTVGNPSSGGSTAWTEIENASGTNGPAQIVNNRLFLVNTNSSGSAIGNGYVATSFDMTGKYTTTFTNANAPLNWLFNFRSSRAAPSGFGTSSTYGMAFILGCDQADPTSSTANGYAVILGNSGTLDPVKLIRFTNGLIYNSSPNNIDVCVSSTSQDNNYYSVKVIFNPCNNQWSLQVRDDNSSNFADPTTITSSTTAVTAIDGTHVGLNLKYLQAMFKYGASAGENAVFDNINIPTDLSVTNTYAWNGTSTNYQLSTAWTPARTCPRVTDILQFNTAVSPATCSVINLPSQSIGRLNIVGNRTVTFSDVAGDFNVSTLTVGGINGEDLYVEAGSTLNFDVASSNNTTDGMVVQLTSGATGSIYGNVVFKNSNSSVSSRPHRLLGTDVNSIQFYGGSIFTAQTLNGEAFGNSGNANTVIFRTGSTYVAQDGAAPFGLTQPSSKVVFNSGSLYRHSSTTAPSLTGRTYANFELNVSGTVNVGSGSSSVSYCNMDTLTITSGTMNFPLTTNNLPIYLEINGDLNFAGGTFNFSPTSTTGTLKIGGTVLQRLKSGAGSYTFGANSTVEMSNSNHLEIARDLILDGNLVLTTGQIITNANEVYERNTAAAAISGHSPIHSASSSSYINGNLRRKITTGVYQFPLGTTAGNYELAKITVNSNSNVDNIAAQFTPFSAGCSYAGSLPNLGVTPTNANAAATLVSDLLNFGYFIVEPYDASKVLVSSPSISYDAEMSFNGHSNAVSAGMSSILPRCYTLLKRNSNCTGNWSLGGGNFTTTTQQASANSTAVVSGKLSGLTSFSQFGMGFSPNTVLPIELVYFTADAYKQQINLKWATASETANDFFEVERSIDGINFTAIQWVASKGNSSAMQYYQTVDEPKNTTFNTTYYYRLKQVDFGGQISYSPVRTATIKADANNQTVIGNCYPNPFNNSIIIPIQSETDLLIDCDFVNVTGQVLLHLQKLVSKDHPILELTELELLPKGVYVLKLQSGNELAHRIMQKL